MTEETVMKRTLYAAAALLACAYAAPAKASDALTGNFVMEMCFIDSNLCTMYVLGVAQGAHIYGMASNAPAYCVSGSVSNRQIVDVATGYLVNNPSSRHLPAPLLILTSLTEAFPCK